MKKVFSVLLSLCLIPALFSACGKNEAEKELQEELSHVQFMDGEGNPGGKRIYKYNLEGLVADMSVSDSLGDGVLYESYKYDSDGNMTVKDVYSDTEHEKHDYAYKNGLLYTEEIVQEPIKNAKKSEIEDAEATEKKEALPYRKDTYSYNDDGKKDEVKSTNRDGKVAEIRRYIYDDEGRIKKERIYDGSENYLGGTEYTYEGNSEDPVLTEYIGEASAKFSKEEMTYSGEKLIKTVRYDKSGAVSETVTVEYDEKDRRSTVTRYDANGEVNAVNKYYYENYVSLIG